MNDGASIAKTIQRSLDVASAQFAGTGTLTKWSYDVDLPKFAVYLIRYPTFRESFVRDVIVVPLVPSADITQGAIERLQSAMEAETVRKGGERELLYVDCYGDGDCPLKVTTKLLSPVDLWHHLISIHEYCENIVYNDIDVIQMQNLFIDRSIEPRRGETKTSGKSALADLETWVANHAKPERHGLAIIGERGSGKTWLLKRFQKEQMDRHAVSPWRNPAAVFVEMRDYSTYLRQGQGIKRTLSHYVCEQFHLKSIGGVLLVESLIIAGNIVLLLDALDELAREISAEDFDYLIAELMDSLPAEARIIITTRETKFLSRERIQKNLGPVVQSVSNTKGVGSEGAFVRSAMERNYRPVFDLLHLRAFHSDDTRELDRRVQVAVAAMKKQETAAEDTSLDHWLESIPASKGERGFLSDAILSLCSIPACSRQLADARQRPPTQLLHLYETVLVGPLIAFNLRAGKAMTVAHVRKSPETGDDTILLNLHKRLEIIELVARFMIEQGRDNFDVEVLSSILSESFGYPFAEILTDLRSQSVFEFGDSGTVFDLRFRSHDMFGYFGARHIFRLCSSPATCQEGLQILGRYRFSQNSQKHIIPFLRSFIEHGAVEFPEKVKRENFICADEYKRLSIDCQVIHAEAVKLITQGEAYSVWSRHLSQNLSRIGIENDTVNECNAWTREPFDLDDSEIVVSVEKSHVLPFVVMPHEVKNEEFQEFLDHTLVPFLPAERSGREEYPLSFVTRGSESGFHPLHLRGIHASEPGRTGANRFMAFTNAYHLFHWTEMGRVPEQLKQHPFVWPSMYVCAIYCNWKTSWLMGPENCCYDVGLRLERNQSRWVPYLSRLNGREGFRLPTAEEWSYAARGGDCGKNPWDLLLQCAPSSEEHRRGELLRQSVTRETTATQDVRKARSNGFGIFGMIGNVREWAHANQEADTEHGMIMGGTWALGEESFDYEFPGAPLPAGNTNLDVGFRMVRSLISQHETIHKAQIKLKRIRNDGLPPKPQS